MGECNSSEISVIKGDDYQTTRPFCRDFGNIDEFGVLIFPDCKAPPVSRSPIITWMVPLGESSYRGHSQSQVSSNFLASLVFSLARNHLRWPDMLRWSLSFCDHLESNIEYFSTSPITLKYFSFINILLYLWRISFIFSMLLYTSKYFLHRTSSHALRMFMPILQVVGVVVA